MIKYLILKDYRTILNTFILLALFVVMIIINESYRIKTANEDCIYKGVSTLNSSNAKVEKCTWACHNNTPFCKLHHVSFLRNKLSLTDPIYNRIIKALELGNVYALMNVVFLVIAIPLLIWFFIIKSWNIQDEINLLKNERHGNYTNDL